MGYFKQLHYELNNTDQKGRHIPTTSMKEGQEWFNQRNKKMYVVKNGKLKLKKGE